MYRAAGWMGTLPIGRAPGEKYPPPGNKAQGITWTGHGAPYPAGADVEAWIETHGDRNIGLRLPSGVIGLDVDAGYVKDGEVKRGDETLAALEAKFGYLPATWVSSARPSPSGIRFYRVPEQLDGREINWPGEAGKFIEIIQPGHRYAVVWPSTNPEAGGALYEWRGPQGQIVDYPPYVESLTPLPEPWVRGLALAYDRTEKADLADSALHSWWSQLRPGPMCPVVHKVSAQVVDELRANAGSRHEVARDAIAALARLGGEGHHGAGDAILAVGQVFETAVGAARVAAGEWHRLLNGAVKLAAADNPAPRQSCEHDALPAFIGPEGFDLAGFSGPGAVASGTPMPTPAPGNLTLPDEFWRARESLGRIRQAAHSRVRSADVVFYGTLVRIAAMAPHTLQANTGVGTPASLNLFAAIVGPSGGGKSSGLSVGRELIKAHARLEEFPLGSGEGIAEAYMGETMQPTGEMARDGSEKQAKVRTMVRHNVLFHSDEGNTLNKLIERAGSTVGETLRMAWSGETIGQKNGRVETTRTVPARSYAAGVVIGYQPSTVLPLLDDYEAGTPQRFLFAWAVDETIPPRSARVTWPGEMLSPFPADVPTDLPPAGAVIPAPPPRSLGESIVFAESILDELYDIEHGKNTGSLPPGHWLLLPASRDLDPFRSQHTVLKIKVSALLALLEGRRNVTAEDWRLAQIVLDTSDNVRLYLQALAAGKARAAREAAQAAESALEWHREHARRAVAEATERTAEGRLAARVAVWVHEHGPHTLGALRKRAEARDRKHVEPAVELAVSAGWVVYGGPDGKVHPGTSRPAG
jgi:hypothetical protein